MFDASCEYLYDLSKIDFNRNNLIKTELPDLLNPIKKIANNYSEHIYDVELIVLESNILNLITLITGLSIKTKYLEYDLFNILKNIIIINTKRIKHIFTKNKLKNIEDAIYSIEDTFHKKILINLLYNIKHNKISETRNINIMYRNIYKTTDKYPPINAEERINIEQNLPQFRKIKQFKKHPISFSVDEIVGVKSDENKWHLGRVLHKYTDSSTGNDWYYVKIEGMSDICNFWINSITYRIQKFKAKKHFLFK
jgi:hypothetical protein